MVSIEYQETLDELLENMIDSEFNKLASKNGVSCNFTPFHFVARDDKEVIGLVTGHAYYKEVHISDLIVVEAYRKKGIGSRLLRSVEEHHRNQGYEQINLNTYQFQAPEFYMKCGYQVEYVRENKADPRLTKYFLFKSL